MRHAKPYFMSLHETLTSHVFGPRLWLRHGPKQSEQKQLKTGSKQHGNRYDNSRQWCRHNMGNNSLCTMIRQREYVAKSRTGKAPIRGAAP